ncbi:hypothetical protein KY349_04430 [Candidatus Woesearchaeota archaeon]|jgi:hypothetical protein|nr:hypothetical protein [Candidatus Woesearchaeota archaeon]
MKKYISFAIMLLFVFAMGCATEQPIGGDTDEHGLKIENFEQCAAAGYPVMESYPRKCAVPDGETFVEEIDEPVVPEEN